MRVFILGLNINTDDDEWHIVAASSSTFVAQHSYRYPFIWQFLERAVTAQTSRPFFLCCLCDTKQAQSRQFLFIFSVFSTHQNVCFHSWKNDFKANDNFWTAWSHESKWKRWLKWKVNRTDYVCLMFIARGFFSFIHFERDEFLVFKSKLYGPVYSRFIFAWND